MKYTAINIGPIVDTLGLARGPRDLWAASYMFSLLMEKIVAKLKDAGFEVISPAQGEKNKEIGLYPDRAFIKNPDGKDVGKLLDGVLESFAEQLEIKKDYMNVMHVSIEEGDEKKVLMRLNHLLDCTELMKRPSKDESLKHIRRLIAAPWGLGNRAIPTIKDIARRSGDKYFHSNYICIVQADGDGMGKTIGSKSLGEVNAFSKGLLEKGKEACAKIEKYGGETIYAGGDDLLFLAPVVHGDRNIIELLVDLDKTYGNINMSFGLSITYHRYPLYEALKAARELLFAKAKEVDGKHAIAWCLRKHSGSGFEGTLQMDSGVYKAFDDLMKVSSEDNQISAIAYKLRANEVLLDIVRQSGSDREMRINAFYDKFIDHPKSDYAKCTRELLSALFEAFKEEKDGEKEEDEKEEDKVIRTIITTLYGMLRTAKFIKGEKGDDDE